MTQTPETQNPDSNQSSPVPAVEVALTGQHLIEASAGTGKTWTLTGIVLRLLIEARRAPEQIIATTFTRAAAAEMRQRIHDRLVDFYQLLQWVDSVSANPENKQHLYPQILQIVPEKDKDNKHKASNNQSPNQIPTEDLNQDHAYEQQKLIDEKIQEKEEAISNRNEWLVKQAKRAHLHSVMEDPINLHLVGYLLDHTTTYSLNEALRRTALVLTTLDKLFVGTLDSLAQKWLIEYSSETGHQQGMAIIDDASIEQVTDSIIHDELRKFQSNLYHQQPKLYQLMDQNGKLTDVSDHKGYVSRSLNFISAPIDEIKLNDGFNFDDYENLLNEFAALDLADIQPYLNPDYRKEQGFNKGSSLFTCFEYILEVHQKIAEHNIAFENYLSANAAKLLKALKDARYADIDGKIKSFNKNREKEHRTFYKLPTIDRLMTLLDMSEALQEHMLLLMAQLNRDIVLKVREKLPIILEERGETTFGLQMQRLNKALTGRQGKKLARYIRHHYPVALIDESQDINGEQASMIESIYLSKGVSSTGSQSNNDLTNRSNSKSNNEFLLLVGDPKQAIYGFRGGDVANYNFMKSQFATQNIWTLGVNRRSNHSLIEALNHWFGMPLSDSKSNALAQLGEGIYYQHIQAHNKVNELSWFNANQDRDSLLIKEVLSDKPVSLLHLPEAKDLPYDEYQVTARHIAALLNSGQTLKGKPIKPSDIGVLAKAKKDLKRVEDELIKLNVPTLTTSDVSIFETIMAEDVAALLSAMLYPYRHDMINRVLTSHIYGLSINEVQAMMTNHESGVSEGKGLVTSSNNDSDANDATQNGIEDSQHKSYQDFISYLKEAAQKWQDFGILSALHHLFDASPIQPNGVWQALAARPEGDRHIMDLRHVLDVLAEYAIGMGEHELLTWFRQNIEQAPNNDWAKQYPLPTDSGVQLMTIHKSKGLEFPIVYVLGMGKASRQSGTKEKYGLYLYNEQQGVNNQNQSLSSNQRRFSPLKGTVTKESYYTDIETEEGFAELRRLGYVAFTRASEQLYIVLQDPKDKRGMKLKPVFYWFQSQQPVFEIPERLQLSIGMLKGLKVAEYYDNHINSQNDNPIDNSSVSGNENINQIDDSNPKIESIEYEPYDLVMPNKYFIGWAKTSFTALARQLDAKTQDLAIADERIDDAIAIDISAMSESHNDEDEVNQTLDAELEAIKTEDDIRFNFVKGANAGTFLHEIFEKIDFNNNAQWSSIIDRAVSSYQLPLVYASVEQQKRTLGITDQDKKTSNNKDDSSEPQSDNPSSNKTNRVIEGVEHKQLQQWIDEVLHTPLLASGQRLVDIAPNKRSAELKFNMGLSETFKVGDINDVFKQLLAQQPDKHIHLTAHNHSSLYRYLKGEIDLVYEHAGKFYVIDYKSNYLGNSLSNYNQTALSQAMSKAGYWLQAAIYQVALHRFLSIRIKDYVGNEEKYLGPVEYVFLRGSYNSSMSDSNNSDNSNDAVSYGSVIWDVPIEFVKALDALFGRPQD